MKGTNTMKSIEPTVFIVIMYRLGKAIIGLKKGFWITMVVI